MTMNHDLDSLRKWAQDNMDPQSVAVIRDSYDLACDDRWILMAEGDESRAVIWSKLFPSL